MNELDPKEWVKRTKSVWASPETLQSFRDVAEAVEYGVLLSAPGPRDKLKIRHPATFSESDVRKLVEFFTKSGETVLDPFLGTGTTALVCAELGRKCIGIELYPEWIEIARARLGLLREDITLYQGDALGVLRNMDTESVDFVVTSPPYWGILSKIDHKARGERISKGLAPNYGRASADYSMIEDYAEFLEQMKLVFKELYRIVKRNRYLCVVVSDFRHRGKYYLFHADVTRRIEEVGFAMHGLINLVQDNKKLYPYGYPTSFVPNICNQFVLVACKK